MLLDALPCPENCMGVLTTAGSSTITTVASTGRPSKSMTKAGAGNTGSASVGPGTSEGLGLAVDGAARGSLSNFRPKLGRSSSGPALKGR